MKLYTLPIDDTSWTHIGKIGKAHGLKGAFYISARKSLLDNIYNEIIVIDTSGQKFHTNISKYVIIKNRVTLALKNLDSRTHLENFQGCDLWAKIPKDQTGFEKLVGLEVFDNDKNLLGKASAFYNHGASDTIEIQGKAGSFLEIPFVGHYFQEESLKSNSDKKALFLCVGKDVFDDLWEEPKAETKAKAPHAKP